MKSKTKLVEIHDLIEQSIKTEALNREAEAISKTNTHPKYFYSYQTEKCKSRIAPLIVADSTLQYHDKDISDILQNQMFCSVFIENY